MSNLYESRGILAAMAKRPGKKASIVTAILAGLLITILIVVPRLLDPDRYHDRVVEELERALGGDIALGNMDWGLSTGLWVKIDSLVIRNATAVPIDLNLKSLSVRISIRPLFSKRVEVAGLKVKRPILTVRLSPPAKTKENPAPPDSTGNDSTPPFHVRVDKILVTEGHVTVIDSVTRAGPPAIHEFGELRLDVRDLAPGARTVFRLEFEDTRENGMGEFVCSGSFSGLVEGPAIINPAVEASVAISGFHCDVIKPYFEGSPAASRLDGDISIDLDFRVDTGKPTSARGSIDLSGLSYTDPSVWDNPLLDGKSSVRFKAGVSAGVISLDSLELSFGDLSILADGLVGRRDGKIFVGDTFLSGRIPLSGATRLIPWKLLDRDEETVEDIMAGGGVIHISRLTKTEFYTGDVASDPLSLFKGLEAVIRLENLSMLLFTRLHRIESISGSIEIHDDDVTAKDFEANWRGFRLPDMDVSITRLTARPRFEARVKGPLVIPESTDPDTQRMLNEYGLASLSGTIALDLRSEYDLARPDRWTADLRADVDGIDATSHPDNYKLEDFRGQFRLSRDKTVEASAKGVSGRLESMPFAIDGELTSGGPRGLVIDAKAQTQGLRLKQLTVFLPALEPYGLDGSLDMDVDIHYPHSNPEAAQLDGTVKARSVSADIPSQDFAIKNTTADLRFDGRDIHLSVDADSGRYKNEPFGGLRLTADYNNRVVSEWNVTGAVGGGTLTASGSVDFTDPEHVAFDVSADIDSVDLASIGTVAGSDTMSITGPVSAKGHLTGRTGSSAEFQASLAGSLGVASGPVRMTGSVTTTSGSAR